MIKEEKCCDGLDCAWCAERNCPEINKFLVDDLNVANCKYFKFEKCSQIGLACRENKDCYFKQLKRLEKKYNNVLLLAKQNADSNEYCLQELEKANEQLKQENEMLRKTLKNKNFLEIVEENDTLKEALEPFKDEYFKGLENKQIAELAKKSIRITSENRKLEHGLEEIKQMLEIADKTPSGETHFEYMDKAREKAREVLNVEY